MNALIIRDDEGLEHRFECHNGFVSRVIAAVFDFNIPDAYKTAAILNAHFEELGSEASKGVAAPLRTLPPEGVPLGPDDEWLKTGKIT